MTLLVRSRSDTLLTFVDVITCAQFRVPPFYGDCVTNVRHAPHLLAVCQLRPVSQNTGLNNKCRPNIDVFLPANVHFVISSATAWHSAADM